jgi:hypothetical protein
MPFLHRRLSTVPAPECLLQRNAWRADIMRPRTIFSSITRTCIDIYDFLTLLPTLSGQIPGCLRISRRECLTSLSKSPNTAGKSPRPGGKQESM